MTAATALARAAVRYARRGLSIFPLAEGTKIPRRGSHGYLDASSDPEVADDRWTETPRANVAAATGALSGFWVLDVDPQHDGPASLVKLEAENGSLPVTIEASTPGGGRHLFWLWLPDGPEIRCSCSRVGQGLDTRGAGGSITLPPSRLRDGRRYRWLRNGATSFADAPNWLVALTQKPEAPPRPQPKPHNGDITRYVATAAAGELRRLEGAVDGQRNATLNVATFSLAGFVKAGLLPEDWTRAQLEERAGALGLPRSEARATIVSAFDAAAPREIPR